MTGTDLIPLCQTCRRPLDVFEQLALWEDGLARESVVEACFRCDSEVLRGRSLRVELWPLRRA